MCEKHRLSKIVKDVREKLCLGKPFFFLKQSKYGQCPEDGGGSTLTQMFLEHFFQGLYIWAKCHRGRGDEVIFKRFGALLHRNYIHREMSQNENFSFCDTSHSQTLPLCTIVCYCFRFVFIVHLNRQSSYTSVLLNVNLSMGISAMIRAQFLNLLVGFE